MKFETCQSCPLKDTCNLIKMDIEHVCTLNGGTDWKIDESKPKIETHVTFESDMADDSLEDELK